MASDDEIQPTDVAAANQTGASSVLRWLADQGFGTQLVPQDDSDGGLRCTGCGTTSPAAAFTVHSERRLEGTSDPDDMLLVVAATCPACGRGGSVALAYGPEASAADSDVVAALPEPTG